MRFVVVCATAFAIGSAKHAQAQQPTRTPTFTLSVTEVADIVEDVGVVRRIDRAEIEALQFRSLDEAIRLLPGVYVRTGGDGTPRVDLRGFRSRHVLLLVDGIPANSTSDGQFDPAQISTESIREIKVSYGSSSMLYGENALAGVVEIITDRPQSAFSGTASVDIGRPDQRNASVRVSSARGKVSFLLGASAFATDGFRLPKEFEATSTENGGLRANSDRHRNTVVAKFGYDASDSLRIASLLSAGSGAYGIPPGTIDNPADPFAQAVRYERANDYQTMSGQFSVSYLPRRTVDLRGWAYLNRQDEDRARYDDATYASRKNAAVSGTFEERNQVHISGGSVLGRIAAGRVGSVRLSLHGRRESFESAGVIRDVPVAASGGGGGGSGGGGAGNRSAAPAAFATRSFDARNLLEVYSIGAEWELHPVTRTGIVIGASESWQQRAEGKNRNGTGWLAGLSYELPKNVLLHASATRKIRFPSIEQLYDESVGNLALLPEHSDGVEIGIDRRWGSRSRLAVTGFTTRAIDFIERDQRARYMNQDRYRFTGAEATIDTRVSALLNLRAAYTLLNATNLSSNVDFSALQYRPRHRSLLDARLTLPSRFSARAAVQYVADQIFYSRGTPTLQGRAPDYALVDVSVSRSLGNEYSVTVGVNNLFDQLYEQSYGLPREGRSVRVSLRGGF